MSLPPLMTALETANYLGVSLRTLLRWAMDQVGPPRLQVGKKAVYKTEALLSWLESTVSNPETRHGRDGTE